MNFIIKRVNKNRHTFYNQDKFNEEGFYLSKGLSKIFMDYLDEGILVDFSPSDRVVLINKKEHLQVDSFNKIEDRKKRLVYFDIEDMKDKMYLSLIEHKYFLFVDFEMSMPPKNIAKFKPEIIQAGIYLTDIFGNILYNYNHYIFPKKHDLNNWTIKFLKLDPDKFIKEAIPFKDFYKELRKVYNKYHPQFVIWGENDFLTLAKNIRANHLPIFFKREEFTNLLNLVKGYFQANRDLGLFDTYKELLNKDDIPFQRHNAYEDAYMTKEVYFYFLEILKEHYNNQKE